MNDPFQPIRHESSPGGKLARAREAQNLSIIEVARHLKLTPAQVEALEADEFDRLPGRVFVRGFIKNYAKLVRLDPAPLLRQIESEIPQAAPVAEMRLEREVALPVERKSRWPVFAGIAFLIVAALAVYEFGFNEDRPNGTGESSTTTESAAVGPSAAPTSPAVPAPAATPAAPATPTVASAAPISPTAPAAEIERPRNAAAADKPDMQGQSRPAAPGERQLHFRFSDDSWVEIRDRDNKVIFSKLNRAGGEERVSGTPPLRLVVGNAQKVQLTADARPIDLAPHIGVTVARVTIE